MNSTRLFVLPAILMLPLLGLTSCATAENDTDAVADNVVQGLSGQGTITPDRPMKDSFGNEFQ